MTVTPEPAPLVPAKPCDDGALPDGPQCPRCGGARLPSGVDGGTWVHVLADAPSAEPPRELTEHQKWQQAVREHEARKLVERRERDEHATKTLQAINARMFGRECDNGQGRCKWCGIQLGRDAAGNRTHVEPERCPGPVPVCERCGGKFTRNAAGRYEHACGTAPTQAKPASTQLERVRQGPGMIGDAVPMGGVFGRRQASED